MTKRICDFCGEVLESGVCPICDPLIGPRIYRGVSHAKRRRQSFEERRKKDKKEIEKRDRDEMHP